MKPMPDDFHETVLYLNINKIKTNENDVLKDDNDNDNNNKSNNKKKRRTKNHLNIHYVSFHQMMHQSVKMLLH